MSSSSVDKRGRQRGRLLGCQEPTVRRVSPLGVVLDDAEDAAFLGSAYGMAPDPWQYGILVDWNARRSDGRYAHSRRGLLCPRQNGKNGIIEVDQLHRMVRLGRRILHTAHQVKTARKAFLRIEAYFTDRRYPELREMVREIRRTNGQEAIVLENGASIEFIARSSSSGRGFTVDDLYLDEAQELTDEQLAAIRPAISAAPSGDPTITYTGTPPDLAHMDQVFGRVRADAQAGTSDRLCWAEWSLTGPADLDDPEVWARYNPGFGIRLDPDTIRDERDDMDDQTFARERLGAWPDVSHSSLIPADTWAALRDPMSDPGDRIAFGIAVAHDHRRATIAVAGERPDGRIHVEVAERRSGSSWVVDWVVERDKRWRPAGWALNPAAPAGHLIAPLAREKVEPILYSGREWAQACGAFYVHVLEGRIVHLGQPELATAVDQATKRPLAEAWQWHPASPDADITPLQAATLAVAALGSKKARKRRTGKAAFV
jgi:hypothetical protein